MSEKARPLTVLDVLNEFRAYIKIISRRFGRDRDVEKAEIIVAALEKQIPTKITEPVCPSCNRIFLFRHGEKRKGDYCDNCGQALDWSDKE